MSMIGYYFQADDLMVQKIQESGNTSFLYQEKYEDQMFDIDKTWHAIHYVLTGKVWEAPEDHILSQAVLGGTPVNDDDMGYGPARLVSKNNVRLLAEALKEWDETVFREKFHIKDMIENDVYPVMEDENEEEFFKYVWGYFEELKKFIEDAAEKEMNLLLFIG